MESSQLNGYRSYQGGYFKTLISPTDTENMMALMEFTLPKGAEPPLHVHRNEDETFYVLEGNLKVIVGDEENILKPGDAVFAPKNTPHAFYILSDTVRMLNLIMPGKLWNYFIEFSSPLAELPGRLPFGNPPSPEQIARIIEVISSTYKVEVLPS